MRAAVWYGDGDIRLETVHLDAPGPREVRIEVAACGVCGTDVQAAAGKFPLFKPPLILGHEYAGTVTAVGSEVTAVRPGQKVTVDTTADVCRTCPHCLAGNYHYCPERRVHHGGFAEFAQVPDVMVVPLPESMPVEKGVFVEPLACALHAVDRAELTSGATVAIVGAGTMGLLILQLVRFSGASKIIVSDPNPARRRIARDLGADVVVDPGAEDVAEAVRDATGGLGADVAFEAVGKGATVQAALASLGRGGRFVLVGVADTELEVTIRPYDVYFRELTIAGSFIRRYTYPRAIRWLERLDVEPLAGGRFSLDQVPAALEALTRGEGIKNVVVP